MTRPHQKMRYVQGGGGEGGGGGRTMHLVCPRLRASAVAMLASSNASARLSGSTCKASACEQMVEKLDWFRDGFCCN